MIKGRAVTYGPEVADYRMLLAALYADVLAGEYDPDWSIDATVSAPAQISAPGDAGFTIVNASGDQICIADHAGVGGVMLEGGAVAIADELLVGVCPGGGMTDIRSGTFSAGARWSGWAEDAQSIISSSHDGRMKVHSGPDYFSVRFKTKTTGLYSGGFFAGKLLPLAAREGGRFEGWIIASGIWSDWTSTSVNDHMHAEVDTTGVWHAVRALPKDSTGGFTGAFASDGSNHYTFSRVVVCAGASTVSPGSSSYTMNPLGVIPCIFFSTQGTLGHRVETAVGSGIFLYVNIDAGCWSFLDDGTFAE